MPLNTVRLNHRPSTHPNERIVFIKPLPRPAHRQHEYDMADTFLRAIAAQCLPIMKTHWLSVTTLEEYEPNSEFMGRNFNAVVQMVMMHELAHNVHMNHSKAFWATRDVFAGELKALWARRYTGEGFWGGGRTLGDLTALMQEGGEGGEGGVVTSQELADLPLCGAPTWKEREEKRIERKFGRNGVALGGDEEARMVLELGRKGGSSSVGVKPRVAASKRGRELRAAAALKRFEVAAATAQDDERSEEGTVSGDEYGDDGEDGEEVALDLDGKQLQDQHGRAMTRVCQGDSGADVRVKQELQDLEGLDKYFASMKEDQDQNHDHDDGDQEEKRI
ncbi:hypothetical protein DV735_g1707, partial [Chaetothyriales sp. CBS 134920]